MTYKELLETLKQLTHEELDQTVTIYAPQFDEYLPIFEVEKVSDTDVLDEGHIILRG